ncbi:MAG TPA: hypothetical protein VNX68_12960 [Nitrosopumilaceae archaeon]|jgi:hypothetical protein|nr:hypothetical protein [Nitrosopumilaceae archaeon]
MEQKKGIRLLNEEQPFGEVHKFDLHKPTFANKAWVRNDLGAINEVGNNARDHAPPDKDYSLGAGERAAAFTDQMLSHWTGRPKGGV